MWHDETTKLTDTRSPAQNETSSEGQMQRIGLAKTSDLLPPQSVEQLRYIRRCVQLPSNDSYRSSLSLFRPEPVPRHDSILQRWKIC